jgi:hypothetical protein
LGTRTAAVQGHSSRAGDIVFLDALLIDELLCRYVAYREEHRGCDGLGEKGPCRQAGLIPGEKLSAFFL